MNQSHQAINLRNDVQPAWSLWRWLCRHKMLNIYTEASQTFWTLQEIGCALPGYFIFFFGSSQTSSKSYRRHIILTLICFKWPENVDNDWDKDCSSPISAKTLSNQGIFADSEDKTWRPATLKKHGEGYAV